MATKPRSLMMGAAAGGLAALVQAKAGAGIDPVPAFGFLVGAAPGRALAPAVAFADVPGVQLNDHLVGFQDPFEWFLGGGGLRVELGAQALGALALAFGFAVEGGAGELHAGEMFEHGAGVGDGPFAGQERGHVLHGGGVAGGFFQTERGVGRGAPAVAAFAVAARALDGDRAVATLEGAGVAGREAGQRLTADRTGGRGGVGFGLRAALDGLAEEFLHVMGGRHFQMAEVLVAGLGQALNRVRQGAGRAGGQHGQGFGLRHDGLGLRNGLQTGCFHVRSLHDPARN